MKKLDIVSGSSYYIYEEPLTMSCLKICKKCGKEKETTEFGKHKRASDKLTYWCLLCLSEYQKILSKKDTAKEKQKERNKRWIFNNPEKHKECRKRAEAKRSKTAARTTYNREYRRKLRSDSVFRLKNNISRQIVHSLKRKERSKHGQSVLDKLGYSLQQLKEHLEKQFDENMNWENYGTYWHIDHIVPHSSFSYTSMDDEEFKKCWSLNNLRPLEAIENIKKSNKLLVDFII